MEIIDWYDRIPKNPDGYDSQETPRVETVGELIALLQAFDPALPVAALWDTMPMPIWRVIKHDDGTVLIDTE